MTEAVIEDTCLKGIIKEFGVQHEIFSIKCDNQSALHFPKHQVFYERSKHTDVRLQFFRVIINKRKVRVAITAHKLASLVVRKCWLSAVVNKSYWSCYLMCKKLSIMCQISNSDSIKTHTINLP